MFPSAKVMQKIPHMPSDNSSSSCPSPPRMGTPGQDTTFSDVPVPGITENRIIQEKELEGSKQKKGRKIMLPNTQLSRILFPAILDLRFRLELGARGRDMRPSCGR